MQKRVKRLRAAEPWEVQPRSVPCTSPHVEGVELPQCQNLLRSVLVRPDFTDNLWHILGFLDCSGVCFARQVCKTWKRTLDETSRESEHWLSFSSAFRPFQYLRPETSCELLLFSTVLRNETLAQRCFDTIVGEFYKGAPSPHSAIPSSSACKAQACSPTCCCVPILACCRRSLPQEHRLGTPRRIHARTSAPSRQSHVYFRDGCVRGVAQVECPTSKAHAIPPPPLASSLVARCGETTCRELARILHFNTPQVSTSKGIA